MTKHHLLALTFTVLTQPTLGHPSYRNLTKSSSACAHFTQRGSEEFLPTCSSRDRHLKTSLRLAKHHVGIIIPIPTIANATINITSNLYATVLDGTLEHDANYLLTCIPNGTTTSFNASGHSPYLLISPNVTVPFSFTLTTLSDGRFRLSAAGMTTCTAQLTYDSED